MNSVINIFDITWLFGCLLTFPPGALLPAFTVLSGLKDASSVRYLLAPITSASIGGQG